MQDNFKLVICKELEENMNKSIEKMKDEISYVKLCNNYIDLYIMLCKSNGCKKYQKDILLNNLKHDFFTESDCLVYDDCIKFKGNKLDIVFDRDSCDVNIIVKYVENHNKPYDNSKNMNAYYKDEHKLDIITDYWNSPDNDKRKVLSNIYCKEIGLNNRYPYNKLKAYIDCVKFYDKNWIIRNVKRLEKIKRENDEYDKNIKKWHDELIYADDLINDIIECDLKQWISKGNVTVKGLRDLYIDKIKDTRIWEYAGDNGAIYKM